MKNIELVVGVKLTVREDLNVDLECHSGVIEGMLRFAGKEVTVGIIAFNAFDINEDGGEYWWNKEMFKEFTEQED